MTLHLLKLCVGCDTVEALEAWHRQCRAAGRPCAMHTRQTPKRAAELVDGGSLYWVFKGVILARQAILEVNTVGEGVARRCQVKLSEALIATAPSPRRPFQGWRYLVPADAPADLDSALGDSPLPTALALRLREIGAW